MAKATTKAAKTVVSPAKVKPVVTDETVPPAQDGLDATPASAGPTPEMQASDPPEAFEPDPNEPPLEPKFATIPSAGPTPETQKDDPPEMFQPKPEPEPDAAAEPVEPLPSAGPTPEIQEQLAQEAAEAEKAKPTEQDDKDKAKLHDEGRYAVGVLVAKGILVPYVETHSSPDDVGRFYVLKV